MALFGVAQNTTSWAHARLLTHSFGLAFDALAMSNNMFAPRRRSSGEALVGEGRARVGALGGTSARAPRDVCVGADAYEACDARR